MKCVCGEVFAMYELVRCTCRISARPGFKRVVAIAPLRAYGVSDQQDRNRNGRRMTGSQSRSLNVGDRVYWRDDKNDLGTVTEKDWAGVTVKWDNRSQQAVLHNDMASVGVVYRK